MSYNITSSKIVSGKIELTTDACEKLLKLRKNLRLPEGSFFDDLQEYPTGNEFSDGGIWYGEFSGSSFRDFLNKVVPLLPGTFTLRVVWEGGDEIEDYVIKGGKVIRTTKV